MANTTKEKSLGLPSRTSRSHGSRPALPARFALLGAAIVLASACSAGGDEPSQTSAGQQSGALASSAGVAATSAGVPANGITTTGTGRVSGRPDTLRATVGVEVVRDNVSDALTAANEQAQTVIDALTDQGVSEQDIQTTDVSVHPRHGEPTSEGAPAITGYAAMHLLEVRLGELERAGTVLDAAVRAAGDAGRLQGVRFSLEDNEELVQAARERAIADARASAEQYADLAGVALGELVAVSETTRPAPALMGADQATAEAASGVPIQSGQQEVTVSITTVWAFG